MRLVPAALLVSMLFNVTATAQSPAPTSESPSAAPAAPLRTPLDYEAVRLSRVVDVVRITEDIVLDGRLEEPAWQRAPVATDFIQYTPRPGDPARERTEVRFLYDDTNLYVGVICYQEAPLVVGDITQDFNFGQSDALNLVLDTLHDRSSGFMFMTNPGGARRDGQTFNDGELGNIDWDGVWDVKAGRFAEGWTAEFEIPFKTLRFRDVPSQEWGFNMTRAVRRISEQSNWAPIPIRFSGTRVSLAGTLQGFEGLRQGRNFNVKPFVTAGESRLRIDGEMQTTRSLGRFGDYDGGFDTKYSLTPSLTLDTTYRTDFAQVEADTQQINLTRFNLFFPEKRDFFLENSGTFQFGPGGNLLPFFSRRIGLSAAGTPIPIIGGARTSGRIGGFDTGFLAMKTETQSLTPSNNYVVGRMKRNLMRSSWIGAIATSRASTFSDYNLVYGADAHFQFYERLEFDTYLLASDTPGLEGSRQARRFQSAWRDDEFSISGQYNEVQTNFNPEVGFVRRGDNAQYQGQVSYQPQFRNNDTIRNLNFSTGIDYYRGVSSGQIETRAQEATMGIEFDNNSNAGFTVTNTFDRLLEPDRIQGIRLAPGDYEYLGYGANYSSNNSRRISGSASADWGEFWDGTRRSLGGSVSVKPDHHLNVSFNYSRNNLELANGATVTNLVGTRIVYGFSPRSFFNAFVQYNSSTREVSTNIRFNIMYRPLSDVYIVYNNRQDTSVGQPVERALIVKVTRLWTF
ncbi:MAG TPA: DUF5916 domain-containing protein [Vicinamibacterales bacterium]|nr:DUF5916 domain-containing protein [Vicinamibacterales bacterium]